MSYKQVGSYDTLRRAGGAQDANVMRTGEVPEQEVKKLTEAIKRVYKLDASIQNGTLTVQSEDPDDISKVRNFSEAFLGMARLRGRV